MELSSSGLGRGRQAGKNPAASQELGEEEKRQVEKLKARDREVRAHEQAHLAAAGPYALGGPQYEYQRGPDGKEYAVGGEVQINASPVPGDPQANLEKARVVQQAALAPAEPSPQDRRVAAQAARQEARARRELAAQRQAEGKEKPASTPEAGQTLDFFA